MTELHIDRLGHHGDGIAPGPVFVPRALPGEVVTGSLTGERLEDVRILAPSAHRVTPPCRHYRACGGCALQHADDAFVADWKVSVVTQALAAQGLDAPVRGIATSPPNSRRRATLHGRRTKKGALVGFHGRASAVLTEIPDCRLLHPDILALVPALEEITVMGGSRKGELALTVTLSEAGPDLVVVGGKPLDRGLRTALAEWATRHDLARLTWGDERIAERRPPIQRMGRAMVSPPPDAFLQATAHGQAALTKAVHRAVGPARRVVDLFVGCGTFALPLAEDAAVHAVEGDAAMLDALDRGWRHAPGLHRVTTETRDLFRRPLLPDELARFDAAVIDPPRAGADAQAEALAKAGMARLALVSCNPVTFARDARRLIDGGWRIDRIDVIDQFRWSPHVELVAGLSAAHTARR